MESQVSVAGTRRPARLKELDGWRAISVLLVIVAHVGGHQHVRFTSQHLWLLAIVRRFGQFGVKIFFVISGFVICRLLLAEEKQFGAISLKAFYYRRIFRILPPLLLYLCVFSILLALGWIRDHWAALGVSLLFLQDIHLGPRSWFAGHTWSLAVEEQFYLTFPAVLVLAAQHFRNRICLAFLGLCALWNLSLIFSSQSTLVSYDIRSGFICIGMGVFMALNEERALGFAIRIPQAVLIPIAFALLLNGLDPNTWQSLVIESLFVPPAIAFILLRSLEREKLLGRLLCSKPVLAIGATSYSIYLWQELFTGTSDSYAGIGKFIPRLIPLLLAIVAASYVFMEKPAMRYGKILSERAQIRRAAQAGAYIRGDKGQDQSLKVEVSS